ncbi:BRO family protein [Bacillus mycoides]|uniref:BRO family protein n=1 Tax=Bacillus mycoides TaxID=1405 RepID=UPI003DA220BF
MEHSNITMMLSSIDEEEKAKISPKQSLGLLTSNNQYWFLTEDGLYEVLMQSRKPIAKQFNQRNFALVDYVDGEGKTNFRLF